MCLLLYFFLCPDEFRKNISLEVNHHRYLKFLEFVFFSNYYRTDTVDIPKSFPLLYKFILENENFLLSVSRTSNCSKYYFLHSYLNRQIQTAERNIILE